MAERASERRSNKPHVVAFALPFQGHINPLLHFVCKIASRGVVVSVVNTEASHAQLVDANAGADPVLHLAESLRLDIRSLQVSDGLPLDFDRFLHRDQLWQSMRTAMITHVERLIRRLVAQASPPVSCLLADTFFVWPAQVARKFGIPFASFYTESVAVYSLYTHWDLLVQRGHLPFPETADVKEKVIDYVPGLPPMKITELTSFLQESDITTPLHKVIYESFKSAGKADWVLSNTVDELELKTVTALRQEEIPFLSIGPLLPPDFAEENAAHEKTGCVSSLWSEIDCTAWLASKPKESVVYVSFGSFSRCSANLLEEFAMGLMESKVPFIWVLRPDVLEGCSAVEEVLPKEFIEGTRDQGMVVKWCSQLQVLRHPSVGGFMTHCGWNSIMEALWIGVPMMGFPLLTDQYTNYWIISEQLRVAKSGGGVSCRSKGNLRAPISRADIARNVKELMSEGEERSEIKAKAIWARDAVRKSVSGSSLKNLRVFLNGIGVKCDSDE